MSRPHNSRWTSEEDALISEKGQDGRYVRTHFESARILNRTPNATYSRRSRVARRTKERTQMPAQRASKPPRQRVRKYDWEAIAAELRKIADSDKPWMVIDEEANLGVQANVHAKKMRALRSDEWDYLASVAKTNQETRTCQLWMAAVRKDDK